MRDVSNYTDFRALAALRNQAQQDPDKALEKVARQFEAIFINMMLQGMREARLAEGAFDSDTGDSFISMYDQQLSLALSEHGGIGLAEMMVRQLRQQQAGGTALPPEGGSLPLEAASRAFPVPERGDTAFRLLERVGELHQQAANPATRTDSVTATGQGSYTAPGDDPERFDSPETFVATVWPYAEQAAQRLGVDPRALVAQAALETGWGRAVIRDGTGRSSHNLFNIKADTRWSGERVAKQTLEYRAGVAVREQSAFRAYDSYAESFDDYVEFLSTNPRYREALQQTDDPKAFIKALHDAGYATDPAYTRKIHRIMGGELLTSAAGLKSDTARTLT